MKIKDYFFLASLNIKRNQKRSLKTIVSLTIGLSFSIISLYIILGFYFGLVNKLDNDKEFNSFSLSYSTVPIYSTNRFTGKETLLNYIYAEKGEFDKLDGLDYVLNYSGCDINLKTYEYSEKNPEKITYVLYDDKKIDLYSDLSRSNGRISFIEYLNIEYMNEYVKETYNRNFFIKGNNINNSDEIIVSTEFIKSIGLDINTAIGKIITVDSYYNSMDFYTSVEDHLEYSGNRYNVVNSMKIVGVYEAVKFFRYEYYPSGDKIYKLYKYEPFSSDIIASFDSINNIVTEKHNDKDVFIKNDTEKSGINVLNSSKTKDDNLEQTFFSNILYFKDFNYAKAAYNYFLNTLNAYQLQNVKINPFFIEYIGLHKTIDSITTFLSIIAIIVVIIALLNIFDIIKYNTIKEKNNIGMMKALGLKDNDSYKVFLHEFSIYMIISGIVSFILTAVIAAIITITTNQNMNLEALHHDIGANINFWYYFLSLAIVIGGIYLLTYIYLIIVSRKLVKKKAIDLLR